MPCMLGLSRILLYLVVVVVIAIIHYSLDNNIWSNRGVKVTINSNGIFGSQRGASLMQSS